MNKKPPCDIEEVFVEGVKIVLDPNNMNFDENNINRYMNEEYGWIDHFGKKLERSKKSLLDSEVDVEQVYSKLFMESKDSGGSDNYAKAYALAHDDYVKAKKKYNEIKLATGLIEQHLKTWYKNHENVQNRSNTIRQEMRTLNGGNFYEESDQSVKDVLGF